MPYDPAAREPALRSSICTGAMVVGFIDRESGRFLEHALARNQDEVNEFCRRVGVEPEQLRHIY
ncbi:MAG: aspartate dehydrogenase [Oscillospiraceae bacterium]|nr:aspartate dehydrogenase [Oscillospiraceae bacterium]